MDRLLIGSCKPQLTQQVMVLAASPLDDSPIPLIPFATRMILPLTGARIAEWRNSTTAPGLRRQYETHSIFCSSNHRHLFDDPSSARAEKRSGSPLPCAVPVQRREHHVRSRRLYDHPASSLETHLL